jgi:hypothetical protein
MAAIRLKNAPETKRAEQPPPQANAAGAFSGYASLFGVVDSGGDMVMAGATGAQSLRDRRADRLSHWSRRPRLCRADLRSADGRRHQQGFASLPAD